MFFLKRQADKMVSDFFKDKELKPHEVRGFLAGFEISPLIEEEIMSSTRTSSHNIDRKKFLIKIIDMLENEKRGKGRKFMNMAGFKSIEDIGD
ncbi:MAG: hypothetical protein KGI69_02845 [Patescibacteria group bacterium]|nr:hypothetical protein [Patescibacteria group bacterium]